MAEIQIGGKYGGVALVDDEDVELVNRYRWHSSQKEYIEATVYFGSGHRTLEMHRLIMPNVPMIDHKNGDPRDNRRSNLRAATHAENMRNRKIHRNNSSGYKGVYREKGEQWYRAVLKFNGIRHGNKRYPTAREAAEAYNALALEYHGEFASLNILD